MTKKKCTPWQMSSPICPTHTSIYNCLHFLRIKSVQSFFVSLQEWAQSSDQNSFVPALYNPLQTGKHPRSMAAQWLRKRIQFQHRITLTSTFPDDTHTDTHTFLFATVQVWEGLTNWHLLSLSIVQPVSQSLPFFPPPLLSAALNWGLGARGWLAWQQMPGTLLAVAHCLAFRHPNNSPSANCSNSH